MAESTVTTKGQITIPKAVRERLHLEPGDKVYFDVQDDGSVSMMTRKHPIESLFGLLKTKLKRPITIEEMNPGSMDDEST
ncbi:MAG TPA: type II toxin-antitoxin system PrlF family antitoxin [Gemmatimonadaceae bacterium]|jgi:AbrB family looped-hinge helix DNA binding protein|nr:type II toxin-antitoxin system PrlF family antitoxin [Gemmatimonadaceae bacterium]